MMRFATSILLISSSLCAQDTLQVKKLQFGGYIKDIQSLDYQRNFRNLTTGNLIHNRVNLKWLPSPQFSGALELRNRLFWGENVRVTPAFATHLRNANEAFNLSANWINTESLVFNSTIDRLWLEYRREKWNVRAGRQRINWGIGTTWNPNDLFNTYNFLDFDYEERPGADGLKFQYNTASMDHLELAMSFTNDYTEMITAMKYFTKIANYDLQFIGGLFQDQVTMGFGWSGSIDEAGFKGEIQYYFEGNNYPEQLNAVLEADYVFGSGWYVSTGALFNSHGTTKPAIFWELSSLRFSPRNLMPTKWNTMLVVSKEITPLLAVTATVIYSPVTNLVLILPSLTYSLIDDLDVSFVWQSFLSEQTSGFDDLSHRCFLRFRYSY